MVTGIIKFDTYGVVGPTQWSVEELKELVKSAHDRGVSVMTHASGTEGISVAIEAGIDSIEHGYYLTTEQLKRMQAKGIAWVPTIAPIGNVCRAIWLRFKKPINLRLQSGWVQMLAPFLFLMGKCAHLRLAEIWDS